MINRENVIKGLACCADLHGDFMIESCGVCPYNDNPVMGTCNSLFPLFRDAIILLRDDQTQIDEMYDIIQRGVGRLEGGR